MTYHCPASFGPNEEFLAPTGEWLSVFRAIAYDSWLLWRHALPDNPNHWPLLDAGTFETIGRLGQRIHNLHQTLPDYRRLNDTPFTVSRWWDPLDDQEDWQLGGRCLLKINGYESRHIPIEAGGRFGLTITPISAHWLEFALREDPVAA
jgi:hypothetical protein